MEGKVNKEFCKEAISIDSSRDKAKLFKFLTLKSIPPSIQVLLDRKGCKNAKLKECSSRITLKSDKEYKLKQHLFISNEYKTRKNFQN